MRMSVPQAEPDLLSIHEFCRALSIGRTVTYELIATGEIMSVRIGRRRLIPRTEKYRYLARCIEQAQASSSAQQSEAA